MVVSCPTDAAVSALTCVNVSAPTWVLARPAMAAGESAATCALVSAATWLTSSAAKSSDDSPLTAFVDRPVSCGAENACTWFTLSAPIAAPVSLPNCSLANLADLSRGQTAECRGREPRQLGRVERASDR